MAVGVMIVWYSIGVDGPGAVCRRRRWGALDTGDDRAAELVAGAPGLARRGREQREEALRGGVVGGGDLSHPADQVVAGQRAVELSICVPDLHPAVLGRRRLTSAENPPK